VGSAIGALTADHWGRKPTIIGASLLTVALGILYRMISDPVLLPAVGFALTVPIDVLVALLFGIFIPELFPTEVRMRASGLVNTLGRGATIVTPFLVVMLFEARGIAGVMALMILLLAVQIVTVFALGIEPRHRSLEELKRDETAPAVRRSEAIQSRARQSGLLRRKRASQ
jgi:putative MFS transporter